MKKYSLFIAVPMTSFPKEEYLALKGILIPLCQKLEVISGRPVFCAPLNVEKSNFDNELQAFLDDTAAMEDSDAFALITRPGLTNSGITFEAGFVTPLRIPQLWLVQQRSDLAYMMRGADRQAKYPIAITPYRSFDELETHLTTFVRPVLHAVMQP